MCSHRCGAGLDWQLAPKQPRLLGEKKNNHSPPLKRHLIVYFWCLAAVCGQNAIGKDFKTSRGWGAVFMDCFS